MEYKTLNSGAYFTFDKIIGESESIKKIIENSKLVADSPSTILIEGESGTGKEVLAQSIHNYSTRKNNRFVAINCGAIPKDIIESELFGYEEGAFTGSKRGGRIGRIEFANKGTLFLDEIGDMSLYMQVKLLRVLQEGKITKLGCNKEINLDIRIIAATNKDLKEEIKKGNFREDLYYRLCVIPVKLPPLRDRKEDIPKLIEYFLKIKAKKLNKKKITLDEELIKNLINYKWPGNIREIENIIENLVNLNGNLSINLNLEKSQDYQKLKVEEKEGVYKYCSNCINNDNKIFKKDTFYQKEINYKIINDNINRFNQGDLKKEEEFNLEVIEKKAIINSIKYSNNNFSKAAKLLGISRNTLYLKVKKYNIN